PRGRGHQDGRVACPPAGLVDGDVDAGHLAADVDDLAHREARLAAEVVHVVPPWLAGVQGAQVRVGQVGDVDVVPDARPVGGGVVGAEHVHRGAGGGRGQHVRDQVGLRAV